MWNQPLPLHVCHTHLINLTMLPPPSPPNVLRTGGGESLETRLKTEHQPPPPPFTSQCFGARGEPGNKAKNRTPAPPPFTSQCFGARGEPGNKAKNRTPGPPPFPMFWRTGGAWKQGLKKDHHLPSLLTCFLSLLSFLRASTSMQGRPLALASSQWEASPRIHTFSFGRGMCRSLYRGRGGEGRGGEGRGGEGRGGEGRSQEW